MDMGDADGARAMLDEVLREGTQMQRDVAQRLADSLG
jgi:pilus assembly protein FimV